MTIKIQSFSFKKGQVPQIADDTLVLDLRDMTRNPHHVVALRTQTGKEKAVQDYVKGDKSYKFYFDKALKHAQRHPNGTIAFGCVGGKHRSVTLAIDLGERLNHDSMPFEIQHRGLE